jgi:hypothetical protein
MYFTVLTPLQIKRTRKTYPGDVVGRIGQSEAHPSAELA